MNRRCAVLACLCATTIAAAAARANSPPAVAASPQIEYVRALSETAAALQRAAQTRANGRVEVPVVTVPPAPLAGPPRFSPSLNDWLQANLQTARLDRNAKERAKILRQLAAALRAGAAEVRRATAQSHAGVAPALDPSSTARAILADPEYANKETGPAPPHQKTMWERFQDWLARLIQNLFGNIFEATSNSKPLGTLLAIALIAAGIALISLVGYRLALMFWARRRPVRERQGEEIAALPDGDSLYASSRDAARRGQYARAATLLFQASLMLLDRAASVAYDPTRTAGEYRFAVRHARASAAPPFDALARIFTLAAYATAPVSQGHWTQAQSAYLALSAALDVHLTPAGGGAVGG